MDIFRFLLVTILILAIVAATKFYKKHPISVAVGCSFVFLLYVVIGLLVVVIDLFKEHPVISRYAVAAFNILRRLRL